MDVLRPDDGRSDWDYWQKYLDASPVQQEANRLWQIRQRDLQLTLNREVDIMKDLKQGYYWARIFMDWDYDTRTWSNPSDEWAIIRVCLTDSYTNMKGRTNDVEFFMTGDECGHDVDEIAETVGPLDIESSKEHAAIVAWNENMQRKIRDGEVTLNV